MNISFSFLNVFYLVDEHWWLRTDQTPRRGQKCSTLPRVIGCCCHGYTVQLTTTAKNKSGGFFLIDIYTQMPHWLLLLTVMTPRSTTLLGGSTHLHTITDRCTSLKFSTDFRAVWVVTNVKTVFIIHVLKRLIMLKITLQSGSCFFVTLCCKKQQDYSITLTCLLSRQSLTWKESCRWASVGLSLTPAVCLYSVGLFKQNKSHLKQLCRFL